MRSQLSLEIMLNIAMALVVASFAVAMLSNAHALAARTEGEVGSYVNMTAQYAQQVYAQSVQG